MYNYFNVKSTNLINLIFISLLSLLGFHQGSEVLVGWGFYVVVVPIVALSIIRLAHRIKIFWMNREICCWLDLLVGKVEVLSDHSTTSTRFPTKREDHLCAILFYLVYNWQWEGCLRYCTYQVLSLSWCIHYLPKLVPTDRGENIQKTWEKVVKSKFIFEVSFSYFVTPVWQYLNLNVLLVHSSSKRKKWHPGP